MTVYHGPYAVFDDDELLRIAHLATNAQTPLPVDKGILRKISAVQNAPLAHRAPSDEKVPASATIGGRR